MTILLRPAQPLNAEFPMLMTPLPIARLVRLVRLGQLKKGEFPSPAVTPVPITTLVRLVQPLNADDPMVATLSGRITLVKLVQLANALCPMLVTLLPITTLVRLEQFW